MKKIILTSAFFICITFAASNPSNQYNYEITAFTSGILTDTKSEISDDNYFNGGLSISKNFKDIFINQVELGFMRSQNLEFNGNNGSTNSNRYFLNAVKNYGLTNRLSAYGLAGLGFQELDQELNDTEDSPFVNYGVGLRYDIPYYGVALKGDIRHLISTKNSQNDFMYTFGLAMPLGKKINNEVITPVVPKVEEEIEPAKQIVDGDDDNDGVLNSKDLCPNTIAGAVVDVNGCELDDDKDGVINRLDKCPNTSAGVKVNTEGCVATVNLNINFDSNSSVIKNQYNGQLQDFANLLKENNKLNATIEAHTDSRGSAKYNQKLSEKRAVSAVKALENQGIEPSRLSSIGYGESQPIATNDTAQGRAENRRVTGLINQ